MMTGPLLTPAEFLATVNAGSIEEWLLMSMDDSYLSEVGYWQIIAAKATDALAALNAPTTPPPAELLEDEDGAPYPEAVQAAYREQMVLRTAVEAVRDDFRDRGARLEAKNGGNGSIRANEAAGRGAGYMEAARALTKVLD